MRRTFFFVALSIVGLGTLTACSGDLEETGNTVEAAHKKKHCPPWRPHCHKGSSSSSSSSSSSGSGNGGSGGATNTTNTYTGTGGTTNTTNTYTHTGTGGTTGSTTSSSSSSSSSSSGSSGGTGTSSTLFTASNPWNNAVDTHPKSSSSDAIINWLASHGGWGGGQMTIDFTIALLTANASTPFRSFTPNGDFYTPDCDHVPVPVPANGAIEGNQGYSCTVDGDCHLLVVHPPTNKLYEMYRANISGGTFSGGCLAVWDLNKSYPPNLRGDGCSSADAGGFPISAMLFNADEVAAGEIPHAIRFILPNERIRGGDVYVHPGSHIGSPTGGANAPPYGVRFRLRSDFPMASLPSNGARVIARAMQKYGMFLSDGGTVALTGANDRFTTAKWTDVGVDSHSLTGIQVSDMEVVDMGALVPYNDCVRNP